MCGASLRWRRAWGAQRVAKRSARIRRSHGGLRPSRQPGCGLRWPDPTPFRRAWHRASACEGIPGLHGSLQERVSSRAACVSVSRQRRQRQPLSGDHCAGRVGGRPRCRSVPPRAPAGSNSGNRMKVAGAPISWGVSELSGWGHRMPPDRVLAEMKEVGFEATELGPPGYLPENPQSCRKLLDRHGLRLVAGFLAVILHDSSALAEAEREATALAAVGANMLVWAASTPGESYDGHHQLSTAEWQALAVNLTAAQNIATAHGLSVSFHPHAGTAIEDSEQVAKLLAATEIGICLDTGHFLLGG